MQFPNFYFPNATGENVYYHQSYDGTSMAFAISIDDNGALIKKWGQFQDDLSQFTADFKTAGLQSPSSNFLFIGLKFNLSQWEAVILGNACLLLYSPQSQETHIFNSTDSLSAAYFTDSYKPNDEFLAVDKKLVYQYSNSEKKDWPNLLKKKQLVLAASPISPVKPKSKLILIYSTAIASFLLLLGAIAAIYITVKPEWCRQLQQPRPVNIFERP